jgi:two-component sensor histidine kinase
VPPDSARPPQWTPNDLRASIDAAGVALWSWNVDSGHFAMDKQGFALWDLPWRASVTFEELSTKIHPADRDRVRAAFNATRARIGSYEIDFRIIAAGMVRWVCSRGQGDDAKIHNRTMHGIFLDVTDRKQVEEANELLAGEMSHRVKNLLTIATSLTRISARSAKTPGDMATQLIDRLMALGRAHDAVRPVSGGKIKAVLLGDLITILLSPYNDALVFNSRIRVAVPRMSVGEAGASALAMVVHELATNSLKHGALSLEEGTLDVSCKEQEDETVIIWAERGGPSVIPPPDSHTGFGSGLLKQSINQMLDGSIEYEWSEEGLVVTLHINKGRLAA